MSSDIFGSHLLLLKDGSDGTWDLVGEFGEPEITQHHDWTDQDGGRVGDIFTCNVQTSMRHSLWKQSVICTNTSSWCHTDSSCNTSSNVRDDGTIKIGSNHDIELWRIFHQLHGTVIYNHFFVFDERISFSSLSSTFKEESINEFHNVGFVNNRYFFTTA